MLLSADRMTINVIGRSETMQTTFFKRRSARKNDVIVGADRRGFQGAEEALVDIELAEETCPRFERPAVMIETLRFVSAREGSEPAEAMTVKAHALYEYLMASARLQLEHQDGQEFRVSFPDAKTYLGIDRTDRLREYVSAINETRVTYDFRTEGYQRSGTMPLLMCDYVKHDDGQQFIAYSMHRAVQEVILTARRYGWLELNAFRKFRSKYTARLYPRLALLAGQSVRKPLSTSPEKLAEELGWAPDRFHWGNFMSRVLEPILVDINGGEKTAPSVSRFRVEMKLVRGTGRGSPVAEIVFDVIPNENLTRQSRAAKLDTLHAASARLHIDGLDVGHTPAMVLVAQAVTATGKSVFQIRDEWKATVVALLAAENQRHHLRKLLDERGVADAFAAWVDSYGMSVPTTDMQELPEVKTGVVLVEPLPRAQRRKEHAIDQAGRAMKQANNVRPGNGDLPDTPHEYADSIIATYADAEMWSMLEGADGLPETDAAVIQSAFGVLARQDAPQMRKSIYNLAGSISAWDLPRAVRVSRAILANNRPE
ncbi:RepB family plasmid replication initiator protein [Rhizobium leguminosarum bv. viciae]|nr:RepB family plasmid replication initiator protein [Rhizobium leguminosarum bv. viciae]